MSTHPPIVVVDESLADLVPQYLESRKKDLQTLQNCLQSGDFKKIETLGHNMKGVAANYGFSDLQHLGASLEQAAKKEHRTEIKLILEQITDYLNQVTIKTE